VKNDDYRSPLPATTQTSFRVFSDGRGHWCVENEDESIAGTFTTRDAALRFAKAESSARGECFVPALIRRF
jgi:hypothetical protein